MWFIIGLIAGAAVLGLVLWMKSKNMVVKWYGWLIGSLVLLLLLFAFQNLIGSFGEYEPTAAWFSFLFLGLPAVILIAIAWQLTARSNKAA